MYYCNYVDEKGKACKHKERTSAELCHHISVTHIHKVIHIDTLRRLLRKGWRKRHADGDRWIFYCEFCDYEAECSKEVEFWKHALFELELSSGKGQTRNTKLPGNVEKMKKVLDQFPEEKFREVFRCKTEVESSEEEV